MRAITTLLCLTTLTATLAACSGDDDEAGTADVVEPRWSAVPTDLEPAGGVDGVAFVGAAQAAGGRPALVVGIRETRGEPTAAVVRTATAQGLGDAIDLEVDGDAAVQGVVAGDDAVTIYGTARTKDGHTAWLRRSTDGTAFSAVDVPDAFGGDEVALAAVVADAADYLLVLGLDEDRRIVAAAGDEDPVELPAAPKGTRITGVEGAARLGDTVVVLASGETDDGALRVIGYRSTDGGESWEKTGAPEGSGAQVNGLVAADGELVATGSVTRGDQVATTWSSTDGERWTPESVGTTGTGEPGWDRSVGVPTVVGDDVFAVASDAEELTGAVVRRTAGAWVSVGATQPWVVPGAGYLPVPLEAGVGVVSQLAGMAGFGVVDGAGSRLLQPELGRAGYARSWLSGAQGADDPRLSVTGTTVEVTGAGRWRRFAETLDVRFSDDALVVAPTEPAEAEPWTNRTTFSTAAGSTVVIGSRVQVDAPPAPGDDSDVVASVPDGDSWQPAQGFAAPGTEFLSGIEEVDGTLYAYGSRRDSFTLSDHTNGILWSSSDNGSTWRQEQGEFDVDPGKDSGISAVCEDPDGEPIVFGYVEDDDRGAGVVAWSRTGDAWESRTVDLGAGARSVQTCGTVDGTLVVQGDGFGGTLFWTTADGETFEAFEIGGTDDTAFGVVPVDGGVLAAGSRRVGAFSVPVVWFSADAEDWRAVDVETDRFAGVTSVVTRGDDLLALLSQDGRPEAALLEDFEQYLP